MIYNIFVVINNIIALFLCLDTVIFIMLQMKGAFYLRFKVGDKVRVRTDLIPYKKYGGLTFLNGKMLNCAGQICTIKKAYNVGSYDVNENIFTWSDEMLEPLYATGGKIPTPSEPVTIEGQLGLPKGVSIHDFSTNELIVPWNAISNIHIEPNMNIAEISQKISEHLNAFSKERTCGKRAENIYFDENTFKEKKVMRFSFYTIEEYRIDKSNNTKIPTITTKVLYKDKDDCVIEGSATCDKTDYNERQGCLEALANAVSGDNFDREYNKAVKWNKKVNLSNRTCHYCGQLFDTRAEKEAHEAWHVERKKVRRERYLLRKRAKEIAFEEQAQKMAKEIIAEDNKK